jgi:hypothetical protein
MFRQSLIGQVRKEEAELMTGIAAAARSIVPSGPNHSRDLY